MLNVVDGNLVLEEKAIYAVEKFLMARRFMYWQVYLHKTGLVAEQLLVRIMQRARWLLSQGKSLAGSGPLLFFLKNNGTLNFDKEVLETFAKLDDIDILGALKSWQSNEDFVLSKLCGMLLERRLLHVKVKKRPMAQEKLNEKLDWIIKKHDLSVEEASNFVFEGEISNKAYSRDEAIQILKKNGKISDVLKESDQLSLKALAKTVTKYYSCYPKKAV